LDGAAVQNPIGANEGVISPFVAGKLVQKFAGNPSLWLIWLHPGSM
jgi:hypothetical protein